MKFIKIFQFIIKFLNFIFIFLFPYFTKNEFYQPSYFKNKKLHFLNKNINRPCDDRFNAINNSIKINFNSYLDIGSQHGYFVFKMAQNNIYSVGVELDAASYHYSNALKIINSVDNCNFLNFEINRISVEKLQSFDVISFLSVFHHIVYFKGVDEAIYILNQICLKSEKLFFFETGEPQEKGYYWSNSLSFLGDNPEKSIIKILKSFNCFRSIEVVGRFENHLNHHKRSLFKCVK